MVKPNPHYSSGPGIGRVFGCCMMIDRKVYNEVGGFPTNFWAEDDAYNYLVYKTPKWVIPYFPGRGYMHYGAQSWHKGEKT